MPWLSDLRQAARALRKSPGTSAVVIGTVALGIGAVTTVLSVVDAFLLKPLPGIERQSRLVNVHATAPDGSSFHSVSLPTWRDLRRDNGSLEDLAAFSSRLASLSTGGEPRLATVQIVTGNFFSVLGARASHGRLFLPREDEAPGRDAVAVVSHRLWVNQLGSDPAAVGRVLRLNGRPFTVVGVAAEGFIGNFLAEPFDLWVPSMMAPALGLGDRFQQRRFTWLEMVGRLRPEASVASAGAALSGLGRRMAADDPDIYKGIGYDVRPATGTEDSLKGVAIGFFGTLLGLSGLVLAIAGSNVSGLLLARAVGRERELSVRLALGAGRGRLLRLLLVENGLLFFCGGIAGVALSLGTTALLERVQLPLPVPLSFELQPGPRVFAAALFLSMAAAVLFGLAGALPATRPGLLAHLRAASTTDRRSTSRLRAAFVAAQVAMSALLLVAAGLFFRTVRHAAGVSPGFTPDGLTMTTVDLGLLGYDVVRAEAAFDSLRQRVAALPGVEAVTTTGLLPLGPGSRSDSVRLPESPAGEPSLTADLSAVGDGYFRTLRLPLVSGRTFGDVDGREGPAAAIVNETLARRLWPGREALGRTLLLNGRSLTIVGVARDAKYRRLWEEPRPFLYLPERQAGNLRRDLVVRSSAATETLVAPLRAEIRAVDPNLPVAAILPVRRYIGFSLLPQRVGSAVAAALGLTGLLLATLGLAAQVAYSVRRRRREIGIRMALGARPSDVVRLETARGARVAAVGIGAGLLGALGGSRLLSGLLFGVSPADPLTFAAVGALLASTTTLLAYLPARRAARVDPMRALRSE